MSVGPVLDDKKVRRFELARIKGISIHYCKIEKIGLVCGARGVEVVGDLVALCVLLLSTLLFLRLVCGARREPCALLLSTQQFLSNER